MWEMVDRGLEQVFVGPLIPATILLLLSIVYLMMTLVGFLGSGVEVDGGLDVDGGFEFDGNADLQTDIEFDAAGEPMAEGFLGGIGAATLRWVNLDRVPLMLWLSTFSMVWWVITYLMWFEFDTRDGMPTLAGTCWISFRNAVIAVVASRYLTRPMHRLLTPRRQLHAGSLVGQQAVIETSQVDGTFGRARFATDAAPLLIRVRTRGETLAKGASVNLVDYDATAKEYIVEDARAPAN